MRPRPRHGVGRTAATAFGNRADMTRLDQMQMLVGIQPAYGESRFDTAINEKAAEESSAIKLLAAEQPSQRVARTMTVRISQPVGQTAEKRLEHSRLGIGRGAESDWVLADPGRTISKRHCVIEQAEIG